MYLSILLASFTVSMGLHIKENDFYNINLTLKTDLRGISIYLNDTELCTSTTFTTCDEYILQEFEDRITLGNNGKQVNLALQVRAGDSGLYTIQETYRDGAKHQTIKNITVLSSLVYCDCSRQKRHTGDHCCNDSTTPGGEEESTEVTTTVSHTNDPEHSTAFPEGGVNVPAVVIPVVVVVLLIILICIVIFLRKRRRQLKRKGCQQPESKEMMPYEDKPL